MENPLISVIVPVYKTEKFLDRCVESLVQQTYKNLEIILVDDGSPDACSQICDAWAERDSRVRVVHKENGGVSTARNAGLDISAGKYISFVDSDDWVDLDTMEYLFYLIKKYDAQISSIVPYAVNSWEDMKDPEKKEEVVNIYDFSGMIKNLTMGCCYLCGKLYDRLLFRSLPDLPVNLTVSEDTMLNYFLFKNTKKFVASNQEKYYYYRHSGSVLSGCITNRIIDDSIAAYNIIEKDFDKTSAVYPYQVYNKMMSDFFLLNSIIRNQKCLDRYAELRKDIIKNRKYAFNSKYSDVFCLRHKIGIVLLMLTPKLYDASILFRKKIRGY